MFDQIIPDVFIEDTHPGKLINKLESQIFSEDSSVDVKNRQFVF